MKLFFKNLFVQPTLPGSPDLTSQAQQLNTILMANILLVVLGMAALLLTAQYVSPMLILLSIVMIAALLIMRRTVFHGRLVLVSHALIVALSISLTLILYLSGTTRSPLVGGYLLILVMAGTLQRRESMLLIALLCAAEYTLLVVLNAANRFPLPNTDIVINPLLKDWLGFTPMLIFTSLFTYFMQKNIYALLQRARDEVGERKRAEEELRRSRDFFQGILNALDDPVIVKDSRGRLVMLNESARLLFEKPLEELVGKTDTDIFSVGAASLIDEQDRRVLETGQTAISEHTIAMNGEQRTFATKVSRYIDPATGERFLAATIRDITRRRRLQEDLEQARATLEQQVQERTADLTTANQALLDEVIERRVVEEELLRMQRENDAFMKAAPGFIYMFRPSDGLLVRWNKRMNEVLGFTDEELSLITVMDFMGIDPDSPRLRSATETLNRGEVIATEMKFHAKDGQMLPVYATAAGVLAEDGLRYVVGIAIDISARAAAEEALRESEERYRTLVEASPDFIVVFDDQLQMLYANNSLVQMAGGQELDIKLSPESREFLLKIVSDFMQGDQLYSGVIEHSFTESDGSLFWYSGVLARIFFRGKPALLAIARDVTERKRTEAALVQSQERLHALLNATSDVTFLISPGGNFLAVNQAAADSMGVTQEQLLHTNVFDLMPPDLGEARRKQMLEVVRTGKQVRFEDDGLTGWSDNSIYPVFAADGSVEALAVFSRDITERKNAEEMLRKSEERYALAARGANDLLWDIDLSSDSFYISPRWRVVFGYGPEKPMFLRRYWVELIHPEDAGRAMTQFTAHLQGGTPHFECEYRVRCGDGSYLWVLSRGLAVRDEKGRPYRVAGSITDISERKRIEARLMHDALHDAATRLPNRALLADRLDQAIKNQRRHPESRFAVLYMDLDRFKDINDSLGHPVGDRLLIAVAHRVRGCLRETDTLARLGGDEFVILLSMVTGIDDAMGVAERIQSALRQPFDLDGVQSFTSASIGIVLSDNSRISDGSQSEALGRLPASIRACSEEILRDADIAMYRAKALGRAQYAVFDASMHSQVLLRMRLETDLRHAIDRGGLEIHYMPIVSMSTGQCESFEALVRWRHPERGLISPADFIPLAEESLLIIPLDRWVLHEACRQLHAWQERWPTLRNLKVNVNLSSKQFAQPDLIDQITSTLRACELSPACLRLEITESAIIENIEFANQTLLHLQELGVQVEIDDFGTGFSALTYLYQLPVNTLKIDRSFTNQVGIDLRKTEIVRTIINLARNIGLDTVAEGVETPEQAELLREMACDHGQGFLFAKPMEVRDVERYIEAVMVSRVKPLQEE